MRCTRLIVVAVVITAVAMATLTTAAEPRRLSMDDYRDKMAGGWIGQMAGVGWGAPTEFKFNGKIIPEDQIPAWRPEMINQFQQDDLYVEMTFLRTLELRGWDVSIRQAGIDWANSGYPLWHANKAGRDNLRAGIAPPDSGHPKFNKHADDIDYQIEADFSGLIAPGMPNLAIELGEKFGRLMNYGDGLYGGQFVGGMYAAAFFESDLEKVVQAGLACIPAGSQYAECIRDVVAWHKENPDDWQKTWQRIEEKYNRNLDYRRFSCEGRRPEFNIDAKINGAYIVMGLLYGGGDMDRTIVIATRCGQDSDCNPSSAAGVLGTALGRKRLPAKFTEAIDPRAVYSHTAYTFPALLEVCEKLARQAVARAGGRVERNAEGREVLVIPAQTPRPGALEQCWTPGPAAEARFTEEERKEITGSTVAATTNNPAPAGSDRAAIPVAEEPMGGTGGAPGVVYPKRYGSGPLLDWRANRARAISKGSPLYKSPSLYKGSPLLGSQGALQPRGHAEPDKNVRNMENRVANMTRELEAAKRLPPGPERDKQVQKATATLLNGKKELARLRARSQGYGSAP